MISDAKVIEKHDFGVKHRARIECRIVNRLLKDAKEAGYTLTIAEYEGEKTPDLKAALFNLDEAHLLFAKNGQRCGWVFLVFGNSGYDLISDYTVNLEDFLKGVNDLADKLELGGF
jgi:hypothetical protein